MLDNIFLFIKIVELGNFTKAAKACNISLPTLSKRISALEHGLKDKLLERTTRDVVLTEFGKNVYRKFESISFYYSSLDFIKKQSKVKNIESIEDVVHIYTGDVIGAMFIDRNIADLMNILPNVTFKINYNVKPLDNKIDKGIYILPFYIDKYNFVSKCVSTHPVHLFCWKNYIDKYGTPKDIYSIDKTRIIGAINYENQTTVHLFSPKNIITGQRVLLEIESNKLFIDSFSHMKEISRINNMIFLSWSYLVAEEISNNEIIKICPEWVITTGNIFLSHNDDTTDAEKIVIDYLNMVFRSSS